MNYQIQPLQGAGPIDFGMHHGDVRVRVGRTFRSFKRSENSSFPSDFFHDVGLFAYYDASGLLEAMEFATPAESIFLNVNLLKIPFFDAVKLLKREDPNLESGRDNAISRAMGISLYAPCAKVDLTARSESVLVFGTRYYD